jgi:hypothetical protein
MKKTSIQIGKTYEVKAGRNTTTVKIESFNRKTGGWVCGTSGGKSINIKDAARFVREIVPKKSATPVKGKKSVTKTERAKGGKPNGKLSGLEAAYRVLADAGRPMNVREIFEVAVRNKYCNLKGATPTLTIYAAMMREIESKKTKSRFVKTGKGLFAAR